MKNNKNNSKTKSNKNSVSKNEVKVTNVSSKKTNRNKIYFGFKTRVLMCLILSLLFLGLSLIFITKSFAVSHVKDINYQENSNLDYKVYLKKNEFYDSEYLGKNMVYVASLIDKISVNFDYLFKIDKVSNLEFNYDVVGKLTITDMEGKNTFFTKDYVLIKDTKDIVTNTSKYELKKNIDIDYDYYNRLANKFRSNYGINTISNLIVYLKISENNTNDNEFEFNNNSFMTLTIPLSEKAINIKMDYKDINKKNKIINDSSVVVNNYFFITLGSIFVLLSIYFVICGLRLLGIVKPKKSKYDKYINRLLIEYDRLIVETTTVPDLTNNKVIKINSFQELLDVRDNLKLPIKYCVVNEHQKCNFYINHDNELYLLIIKAVDFDKK